MSNKTTTKGIYKHRLIVTIDISRSITWDGQHPDQSIHDHQGPPVAKPCRYLQQCFIAMTSLPKELLSMLVCFLRSQHTNAQLWYMRNPVLDLLTTMSDLWSALTYKPLPLWLRYGWNFSSLSWTCPNLLEVHSQHSKSAASTTRSLGEHHH